MNESEKPIRREPSDVPGTAVVEQGYVILDGPNGVAATMTPKAATQTAESLLEAARQAQAAPSVPNEGDVADGNSTRPNDGD